ncbi:hypothetical protein BDW74DRAFT_182739 [Aspergillus multicolor]|uniref:uncharacterized protein n=1 Tax=Aspergillus multicolor TaxID=41759 RepID=UPI003CCDC17B
MLSEEANLAISLAVTFSVMIGLCIFFCFLTSFIHRGGFRIILLWCRRDQAGLAEVTENFTRPIPRRRTTDRDCNANPDPENGIELTDIDIDASRPRPRPRSERPIYAEPRHIRAWFWEYYTPYDFQDHFEEQMDMYAERRQEREMRRQRERLSAGTGGSREALPRYDHPPSYRSSRIRSLTHSQREEGAVPVRFASLDVTERAIQTGNANATATAAQAGRRESDGHRASSEDVTENREPQDVRAFA